MISKKMKKKHFFAPQKYILEFKTVSKFLVPYSPPEVPRQHLKTTKDNRDRSSNTATFYGLIILFIEW